MKVKVLLILTAAILLCGCAVGGTVAWLSSRAFVKNTFIAGDITLELTETTGSEYKLIPGTTIAKDPKVTVYRGSESCWLFVKIQKQNDPDAYIDYAIADGWTPMGDGVYYRQLPTATADVTYSVLQNDQISVKESLKKADLAELKKSGILPTISFTAYAIQQSASLTVEQAWEIAKEL